MESELQGPPHGGLPTRGDRGLRAPDRRRGGQWQTALFAAAIAVDRGGVYATSRRGSRRIHSARSFAERHELFIIIAIGESLPAVGAPSWGWPPRRARGGCTSTWRP